jgi:hypothetical protein
MTLTHRKKVSEKVRKILEKKFEKEIEFYDFCVQGPTL